MKAKRTLAVLLVAIMLLVPFSSLATAAGETIISGPIKTVYTDCEYFNPQGLVISVDGVEIPYTPINEKFKFVPGLDEKLTTQNISKDMNDTPIVDETGHNLYTADVDVYYNEVLIGTVTVDVSHVWGETSYMDNNYHGHYCLGCGIVDEITFGAHNVPEYIPNDDGGLFIPQTETGTCADCNAEITRRIKDTEKFNTIFDTNRTELETELLTYITLILVGLVQLITGIQ
ncbi:MAG: hypothetical protein IIX14_05315 [Clostridia bacterium]|nr:hypothetical protein [Clostridia bacterium]